MKKLLLIQPGAFGDILICAPIAKWYADQGYKVSWPVREKFLSTIQSFNYVTPVVLSEEVLDKDWLRSDVMKILPMREEYDKVINLADRGPHPTAQQLSENSEACKYRLAEVPFEEKYNLQWNRNEERENHIYNTYVFDDEYAFVHSSSSDEEELSLPAISLPVVENHAPEGYTIFDWYKVLISAKEIYCTESAIHCFCDGIAHDLVADRYLLPREAGKGQLLTTSSFWNKRYFHGN